MKDPIEVYSFLAFGNDQRIHLGSMLVPHSIAISLLGLAVQDFWERVERKHVHHFLVDLTTAKRLTAELLGIVPLTNARFRTLREALNHLRDLAKKRGMSPEEVVRIETSDDGTEQGLTQRARLYMEWLHIPAGIVWWGGGKLLILRCFPPTRPLINIQFLFSQQYHIDYRIDRVNFFC